MTMSVTMQKQMLYAEIIILIKSLNEANGGMSTMPFPSQEEIDKADVPELESMKRELRDLARTLGGVRGR